MEAAFARFPGGTALLQTLFDNVRASLASGLHLIFVCSAVIMVLAVLLHVLLRSEPLRDAPWNRDGGIEERSRTA